MTAIISFVNLKGGVGKTALSVNFAAYCGMKDRKTLLIDMDPQTNATLSCISLQRWKKHSKNNGTIANIMGLRRHTNSEGKKIDPQSVIISNVFYNVDLLPSHLDLVTIDLDLAPATARETKLKRALKNVVEKYDIVICDCPPNLTIPTQNALAMSRYFAVPVSPDFLSGIGVGILLSRVKEFSSDIEQELENIGIILSRVGRPAKHRDLVMEDLENKFPNLLLSGQIKERVAVSEAASKNKSIFQMGDKLAKSEFEVCYSQLLDKIGE